MMSKKTVLCSAWIWVLAMLLGASVQAQESQTTSSAGDAEPDQALEEVQGFPVDQIEQLVAPIALYPDALLAQILVASTYPLDIVQSSRWVADHSDLEGEELQTAVSNEAWDPSVQALAFFPSVLGYMNDNLDWTQDLGEAFLGQDEEVMDAIQRLRLDAHEAGNLEPSEQQQVIVEGDTVVVQPADPEVVYVPSYDPSQVYNQPPPQQTYYPSTYTQPVTTTDDNSDLVSFGVGALAGGLLTAAIMWDNDDYRGVYYGGPGRWGGPSYWSSPGYRNGGWRSATNIRRDVNIQTGDINVNKGIGGSVGRWEHNSQHRGNIRYKNERTKTKYANNRADSPVNRNAARGRTNQINRDLKADRNRARTPAAAKDRPRAQANRSTQSRKRDVNLQRPTQTQTAKKRSGQRPSTGRTPQPKTQNANANRKRQGGHTSAYKKSSGKLDRAASKRGSRSANRSGHASRGGGGRGRRG